MKKHETVSDLSKRETRIAGLILDHFSELYAASAHPDNVKSTIEDIRDYLPQRTASKATIRNVAEKSELFTISGSHIRAASTVWADITYKIEGAVAIEIGGNIGSVNGGTIPVLLSLPAYRFTVEARSATPHGSWEFTTNQIIVRLTRKKRALQGPCRGRGHDRKDVITIAIP